MKRILLEKWTLHLPGLLVVFLLGSFILSCTPKLERFFASGAEVNPLDTKSTEESRGKINGRVLKLQVPKTWGKQDPEAYLPDLDHLDHHPVYTIRVNFHFMDAKDSGYNYGPAEAKEMIRQLMISANQDLQKNNAVWLPYGNQMPVLPIGYRMEIAKDPNDPEDMGIYFHQDDDLAFYIHKGRTRNLHRKEVIQQYGRGLDSIMNIFIMPHHPDSVLSPTYHVGAVGIYLGNAIKMAGMFELQQPGWAYRGVLNHEMGHALGLYHAWGSDGCTDTPQHRNECWNRTKSAPCDTAASNNIMDYNAYQNAWSPCQVGKVRRSLSNVDHHKRPYLLPFWERRDSSKNMRIQEPLTWNGARDLRGDLILEPGAHLTIAGRVGMPLGAKIVVKVGAVLELQNALIHHPGEEQWQGVELERLGKQTGQIWMSEDSKIEGAQNPLVLPKKPIK